MNNYTVLHCHTDLSSATTNIDSVTKYEDYIKYKAKRANKCRVIRDGIVIHTGELSSLKHGKDDIKEAGLNMECGLSIKSYNDIVEGDLIETFEQIEVVKTL